VQLRVARRVELVAEALLRELHADDGREAMLAVAFFILKLVDEGLVDDAGNQSVLVALHLAEDARAEGNEWAQKESAAQARAGGMLVRAQLMGLFPPVTVQLLASRAS